MQQPLFTTVSSDWVAPDINTLPSWEGAKRVAICGMGGRLEPPGDVLLVCSACLKKLARMRLE